MLFAILFSIVSICLIQLKYSSPKIFAHWTCSMCMLLITISTDCANFLYTGLVIMVDHPLKFCEITSHFFLTKVYIFKLLQFELLSTWSLWSKYEQISCFNTHVITVYTLRCVSLYFYTVLSGLILQ